MKAEELLAGGQLIKSKVTEEEIEGSLKTAEHFKERAKGNLNMGYCDVAFSLAYQSMFHSARALLFRNGMKERSHSALISALKEIYGKNHELKRLIGIMGAYKVSRHAIQYRGAGCSEADAKEAISEAEKFIDAADSALAEENKTAPPCPKAVTRNK